jgi:hypothetical protein
MQDGQGYDGLAGMGMGTGAGTVWQPEGSRFMLMDGEHAVDPHLQPVQSEQPLQVGYMTPSSALSTLGSTRDSPEGIDPTPVLPILSRNLFPNRRNPPAAAQEPTYHIPPNVSAFTAASPRVQRASHQAWIKSLWMNAAMTRMPKMVMTVDVDNLEGFFPNTEQRHQVGGPRARGREREGLSSRWRRVDADLHTRSSSTLPRKRLISSLRFQPVPRGIPGSTFSSLWPCPFPTVHHSHATLSVSVSSVSPRSTLDSECPDSRATRRKAPRRRTTPCTN